MSDVLFLIPPPHPGAVLRGAGRHVWVKGSTPGARHRPGRWWRQLLRHREVGACNNLLTKWWTLFHHCLWSAEPFEDGPFKLYHVLPMNPFTCRMFQTGVFGAFSNFPSPLLPLYQCVWNMLLASNRYLQKRQLIFDEVKHYIHFFCTVFSWQYGKKDWQIITLLFIYVLHGLSTFFFLLNICFVITRNRYEWREIKMQETIAYKDCLNE